MSDISPQTLQIVAKELTTTLNEARVALEAYAERTDQIASLEKCADQLHFARGVLQLVEVHGASLLAEEMELVTRHLLAGGHDQKRQSEGLDALMRAMVQLPAYLERVLSGGRDVAPVLLPLLNDLRSVRGGEPAQPQLEDAGEPTLTVAQWAKRLRPQYQMGLLGYIRGERTVQNLEVLSKVAEKLERVATTQPVFQLWWVVGALLEAVRDNGLDDSAALKRLLGDTDRQIKALYDMGEARYSEYPPSDLLDNMLYHVARATADGGRIAAVRTSFKLGEPLPVDDSIEQERESLSGHSVKLMQTVAAAIREDLSKVKDVLDIFARRGDGRSDELIPQLGLLKKIGDTLGMLGLGELRQRVQQEISELSAIVTDGRAPLEASLIRVAGVLLAVEDGLDDRLVRSMLSASAESAVSPPDQDREFRLVSEAVLRECIVNLARIKEAVSIPPQGLDTLAQLLRGITAGLLMLDKGRAAELMDKIGIEVRRLVEPGTPEADALRLERIADAIMSIEYYMEALQNQRNDPWQMLDNAETSLNALSGSSKMAEAGQGTDLIERKRALENQLDAELANSPAPEALPAAEEDFDHEIAAIYSEEATELIEAAEASLSGWNQNRRDKDRVAELQRQLHTLKGGARMAGISAMGDLSHELETLVISIESGRVAADDHALAIMQASLDELARMRDLVSVNSRPAAATGLLRRIRAETVWSPPVEVLLVAPPAEATFNADAPNDEVFEAGSVPVLPGREAMPAERAGMARVDAELLDTMLNNAGEVSIYRARVDQQVNSIDFNLAELARTVTRLKEQLRGLEIETEAQVLSRHHDEGSRRDDFNPLELDRYSALQTFTRALAETSGDVAGIQGLLETLTREAQNLLTGQARVITDLQNSLMRTRMVPFQRHVQRLSRLVRQAANDTGKRAELVVQGASAELDRQMLERMVAPLEHMLRNAVVHGIETPERRAELGKPEAGRISVSLTRDGAEVVVVVHDDGGGIDVELIREKAIALGLVDRQGKITGEQAMQLILEPGFSTAGQVTQAAGRGVGMDVVATEVKKLGGGLFIESTVGKGSRFTIRLPFTLAISQALIVRVAEETYALPVATVEGVVRLSRNIVARHLGKDAQLFEYGGHKYRFQQLGSFVGVRRTHLPEADVSMSVVLIRAGEHSTALVTDELEGSREIVVKSLGPQVSGIRGIAGATILGDGRIVIILDMGSLVRSEWRAKAADAPALDQRDRRTFALVVDDSITVRRVTQRLLERNGMRVLTAKDGVDAVALLQENIPDIILLDIEMPRMDGFAVAAHVRGNLRLRDIPIVMVTSRVSEKHRARAIELGVDDYLGKPYQESQLLDAIEPLVNRRSAVAG